MKLWGVSIQGYAVILQAVSIFATAVFAIIGLNAWRRQLIGKRRIEVAEEALLAVYKTKDAMSYIRSPGAFADEGRTRARTEHEKEDDLARTKDTFFVPLERMHKVREDFAALQKVRLLCVVYFGVETGEPFDAILRARRSVSVAAGMLLEMVGKLGAQTQQSQEFMEQMKREIWEGYGTSGDIEKDSIFKSVTEAARKIEALCRPHLKAERGNALWQWLRKSVNRKQTSRPSQG